MQHSNTDAVSSAMSALLQMFADESFMNEQPSRLREYLLASDVELTALRQRLRTVFQTTNLQFLTFLLNPTPTKVRVQKALLSSMFAACFWPSLPIQQTEWSAQTLKRICQSIDAIQATTAAKTKARRFLQNRPRFLQQFWYLLNNPGVIPAAFHYTGLQDVQAPARDVRKLRGALLERSVASSTSHLQSVCQAYLESLPDSVVRVKQLRLCAALHVSRHRLVRLLQATYHTESLPVILSEMKLSTERAQYFCSLFTTFFPKSIQRTVQDAEELSEMQLQEMYGVFVTLQSGIPESSKNFPKNLRQLDFTNFSRICRLGQQSFSWQKQHAPLLSEMSDADFRARLRNRLPVVERDYDSTVLQLFKSYFTDPTVRLATISTAAHVSRQRVKQWVDAVATPADCEKRRQLKAAALENVMLTARTEARTVNNWVASRRWSQSSRLEELVDGWSQFLSSSRLLTLDAVYSIGAARWHPTPSAPKYLQTPQSLTSRCERSTHLVFVVSKTAERFILPTDDTAVRERLDVSAAESLYFPAEFVFKYADGSSRSAPSAAEILERLSCAATSVTAAGIFEQVRQLSPTRFQVCAPKFLLEGEFSFENQRLCFLEKAVARNQQTDRTSALFAKVTVPFPTLPAAQVTSSRYFDHWLQRSILMPEKTVYELVQSTSPEFQQLSNACLWLQQSTKLKKTQLIKILGTPLEVIDMMLTSLFGTSDVDQLRQRLTVDGCLRSLRQLAEKHVVSPAVIEQVTRLPYSKVVARIRTVFQSEKRFLSEYLIIRRDGIRLLA